MDNNLHCNDAGVEGVWLLMHKILHNHVSNDYNFSVLQSGTAETWWPTCEASPGHTMAHVYKRIYKRYKEFAAAHIFILTGQVHTCFYFAPAYNSHMTLHAH